MIKFFRKIRQKLITENRFSKYIFYAIGEIILVMIGILLALQVNNWNEIKKEKAQELKILMELRKDVAFSVHELDEVAFYNKRSLGYLKEIQRHLYQDLPYTKQLDTAFGGLDVWTIPYLPFTTYETIKAKGIDQITNDSLKKQIIKVYEFSMKYLLDDAGGWEWSFSQNTTQDMMINHIRRDTSLESSNAKPNDYENLKKNEKFGNFLNILTHIRDSHVDALEDTKKQMEILLDLLDSHINNSKN